MVSISVDTDVFGTFTGEVPRLLSPVETLRAKCELAFKNSGISLIVASEGSFGPHPNFMFVPADEEFIMLKDFDNRIEIIARFITTETNFNAREIGSEDELLSFAEICRFPDHAIILKSAVNPNSVENGIADVHSLKTIYNRMKSAGDKVVAETDMRAMHNPTRMRCIGQTCRELIRKIESACPKCNTPGFDVTAMFSGLPCERCGAPTKSALSYQLGCNSCGCCVDRKYPFDKEYEDPMYCDFCNP